MGLSTPFGNTWESTAPTPYVRRCITIESQGEIWVIMYDYANCSFSASNALTVLTPFQGTSLQSRWFIG